MLHNSQFLKIFFSCLCCFCIISCASHGLYKETSHRSGEKRVLNIERPETISKDLAWDIDVGAKAYDETLLALEQKGMPVDHEKDLSMQKRLNGIMTRLRDKTLMPSLPFEVHLIDSEIANAACYPGGKIVFFSGIFDLHRDGFVDLADEDEIAAVMAHEMAHGELRHTYMHLSQFRELKF